MAGFCATFFVLALPACFLLPAALVDFAAVFAAGFLTVFFLLAVFTALFLLTPASLLAAKAGKGLAIMVKAARKARMFRRMGCS
ncbi:MAG: hypothetical protein ACK5JI_03090 [Azonexus sp.]